MRNISSFLLALALLSGLAAAQAELPIDQLFLYKNGMAYVVRNGQISQPITLSFHRDDLNDILKNLIAWNPQTGVPYPLGYSTAIPGDRLLQRFPFDLRGGGLAAFLYQMKGAELQISLGNRNVTGKLLGVEAADRGGRPQEQFTDNRVTLLAGDGQMRNFWLSEVDVLRFQDSQLNQQMQDYLQIVRETSGQTGADVTIQPTPGSGPIRVAYVQQFPVWKTSYRLELGQTDRLQGWVQIDNPTGEAWQDVELTLVSGSPVSFVMDLYPPLYASRQRVPVPNRQVVGPVAYEGAVQTGRTPTEPNTIYGTIRDESGVELPGVSVEASSTRGGVDREASTDFSGYYQVASLEPGTYQLQFSLPGFSIVRQRASLPPGGKVRVDAVLPLGTVSEVVELESVGKSSLGRFAAEESMAMAAPAAPPPPAPRLQLAEAESAQVEDYFEYRFPFPVTLQHRDSALLPFLSREIEAETVSVFNSANHATHPYNSVRLENSSGVPLEPGPVTVFQEGRYAGEAVLEYLNRGAQGLISYGLDYETAIASRSSMRPEEVVRLIIQSGVARFFKESLKTTDYQLKSSAQRPKSIIIEHPLDPSLTLKSPDPKETTPSFYRFQVELQPNQEIQFPVQEIVSSQSSLALRRLDRREFLVYFSNLNLPADLKAKLEEIVQATTELNQLQQERNGLQRRYDLVSTDQTRIRENLSALGKTSGEKQLTDRYIRQLQAQEDELDRLKQQREELQGRIQEKEAELDRLLARLSFEGDLK